MSSFVERYRHVNIYKLNSGEFSTQYCGTADTIEDMRSKIDKKARNCELEDAVLKGIRLFHQGVTAPELRQYAIDHAVAKAYARGESTDISDPDEQYLECLHRGFRRAYNHEHGFIDM